MKARGLTAVLLGAVLLLSACGDNMADQPSYQPQEAPRLHSPPASLPRDSRRLSASEGRPDVRQGQRLFAVNCAHCHGVAGHGDGPVAPYLKDTPKNLHAAHVQGKSDGELYGVITEGEDAMPAFRLFLSDGERRALVAFLRTFGTEDGSDANGTGP